jgi:hypothetical protein
MPTDERTSVRGLLLTRRGLVFVSSSGPLLPEPPIQALELELAEVGYVLSSRLRARLRACSLDELVAFRAWALETLLAHVGGNRKHEPLFRSFPQGIPEDTEGLWWAKVLVHFLQAQGQPCLFCGRDGTTHVLNPCRHVVCDRCFDGSSYSACPCCEHQVDRSSPFFKEAAPRETPREKVVFRRLDLGEDPRAEARSFFGKLCERKQALSPRDRDALVILLKEYRAQTFDWLPPIIPLKENVGVVFGTLFQQCPPHEVLPVARRYLRTATDVLRFIAVASGTDGSLLPETIYKVVQRKAGPSRFWGKIAEMLGAKLPEAGTRPVSVPLKVRRFKVAKLSRALRRTLLDLLEGMEEERLLEDLQRHRSYWVWVGEFLHPHEYAARFPKVARAFQVLRQNAPDGTPTPQPRLWNGRLEDAVQGKNPERMLSVLEERPGEFGRRLDLALRVAGEVASEAVLAAFRRKVGKMSTPVLLTLKALLPTRSVKAAVRVFWPKGRVSRGIVEQDHRATLTLGAIAGAVAVLDAELLRRFGSKPSFDCAILDPELGTITAPFNQRSSSATAVDLTRGSRVAVPLHKTLRLFLHWCQPEKGGRHTDLDLSVAFYSTDWKYQGVCSYYQLQAQGPGGEVFARSAGDLRDAPWPDGATEFVDVDLTRAKAMGIRYAVAVINNYAGLSFAQLARGFAGLMLREDPGGKHFDPRSVELKFALAGDNGIFLPLVLDLEQGRLHWLDVQSKGNLEMNNVEKSKSAIALLCPALMTYFLSGVRPSMYDVGLLHAAARCRRVFVRHGSVAARYDRRPGEAAMDFYARIRAEAADEAKAALPREEEGPVLALLHRGDLTLPPKSSVYALFREKTLPSLEAADLLS